MDQNEKPRLRAVEVAKSGEVKPFPNEKMSTGDVSVATPALGAKTIFVAEDEKTAPALRAHALRLLPEMLDYPAATEAAVASVDAFDRIGLGRSSAYSALSASRFLAREGRIGDGASQPTPVVHAA